MKNIDDLDMSSINRMFNGLKPVTIAPDFESGKMLPNISHEMYAIFLLEEEQEIKTKCREAAMTLNNEIINVYLFDLAEQKKEIETLWTEGVRITYEIEGKDIQFDFHPFEGKKFIDVKVKHIDRLNEYLNSLISLGIKKHVSNQLSPETPLKGLFKDGNKYDKVMQLMIKEHLIIQTVDGLQWHGYKRNAKYEPIAFVEALSANGLLNKKSTDYSIVDILSGTFLSYTCSDKTARNRKINTIARPKYDTLLNSI